MILTLTEQFTLATDPAFIGRVLVCCVKAAIDVLGEACGAAGQPTNSAHIKRAAWARDTLSNPRGMAERLSIGVVAGGIITAESTDSDLQWTVNGLVDDYAGVD